MNRNEKAHRAYPLYPLGSLDGVTGNWREASGRVADSCILVPVGISLRLGRQMPHGFFRHEHPATLGAAEPPRAPHSLPTLRPIVGAAGGVSTALSALQLMGLGLSSCLL